MADAAHPEPTTKIDLVFEALAQLAGAMEAERAVNRAELDWSESQRTKKGKKVQPTP